MAQYDATVLTRMTSGDAARLDEVAAMEPVLANRPAAVRRLIEWLDDDDLSAGDAAEGKEGHSYLHPDDVAAVLAALSARTRAYSELAKQVRALGTNLNQLTKLGHKIAKYANAGMIPTAAVDRLHRTVDALFDRVEALAEHDLHVEEVVRACRSR